MLGVSSVRAIPMAAIIGSVICKPGSAFAKLVSKASIATDAGKDSMGSLVKGVKDVTSVQVQRMCAIRIRVDVCALPIAMDMSVVPVRSTPGAMYSSGDVPIASVTLQVQSARAAIALLDSATARKASRGGSATIVPSGIMDIPTVDGAAVMKGDRLEYLMEVLIAMITDNAIANRWLSAGPVISVNQPHLDWWREIQMAAQDVSASDDPRTVSRVSFPGDRFVYKAREI